MAHLPERNSVLVTIRFPSVKALPTIVARVRRVFDLGRRDHEDRRRDPRLAPLIRRRPGLRRPATGKGDDARALQANVPPAWRPWHAYAAQHLRMANQG